MSRADGSPSGTSGRSYTDRLMREEGAWWKRVLDIRRIYRWNLRRLDPGFTLDVGCGLGRNLVHLGGRGVGVDHNPDSVEVCQSRGLTAYTPDDFRSSEYAAPERFDSILLAHVIEHMHLDDAADLLVEYLPFLRQRGRVIVITPQEYGYRADPTHVEFVDLPKLRALAERLGLEVERAYSFPLPHAPFGRLFRYNEFVLVAQRPTTLGAP